jgi:predicted pyridoxine 5'-phosphate oxidase superfamily flavin-nucleotide-binding protein
MAGLRGPNAEAGWHAGERAVQRRLGGIDLADRLLGGIRTEIPEAGRRMVTRQPWLLLATCLPDGDVWPAVVSGRPGFMAVPAPDRLTVAARPASGDPLGAAIAAGAAVGTLVLEPAARRRMRVNGRLQPDSGGFAIAVDQALSNCPKYIQRRDLDPAWRPRPPALVSESSSLSAAQQAWIERADTGFLATAGADGTADMSHRGGLPGFLAVDDGVIGFDELPGNSMYLTLGNLEQVGTAGLLVVDHATGSTLHVSGDCAVTYAEGAPPRVSLRPRRVIEQCDAAPAPWSEPETSPFLLPLT